MIRVRSGFLMMIDDCSDIVCDIGIGILWMGINRRKSSLLRLSCSRQARP